MKRLKKLVCLMITVALVATSFPLTALPVAAENWNGLRYRIEDGTAIITGCDDTVAEELVIPGQIGDVPVTGIEDFAFFGKTAITAVVLPGSLLAIGDSAFSGCTALTEISIPNKALCIGIGAFYDTGYANDEENWVDGVLYVGKHLIEANDQAIASSHTIKSDTVTIADQAFFGLDRITEVFVPESVCRIGKSAFAYCGNLADLHFANGLAEIDEAAFYQCGALVTVAIPDGVRSIGWMAFSGCDNLTTVILPNSEMVIGNAAFSGDIRLTTVTGGIGVTSIGDTAFYRCSALETMTFGQNLQEIGREAFSGCRSLTAVTIPDSVTVIGENAFLDCTVLTDITLPETVLSIERDAFYNTGAYNSADSWEDGVLYIGKHLIATGAGQLPTAYGIKSGTLTVADGAFSGRNITTIAFPNSLCRIGQEAFFDCESLLEVTVPDSVSVIGDFAFMNCEGLYSVTVAGAEIGEQAFDGCTGLIEATVQSGSIGWSAFAGCTRLATLTVGSGVASIASHAFDGCESLTRVSIAGGRIAGYAFVGCTGIKTLFLGNGVTAMEDVAFPSMPDLQTAVVQNGRIYDGMFYGCANLTSMTMGSGVTAIGEYAFYGCSGLTALSIPASVRSIGDSAFSGCTGLQSIRIPSGVRRIGDYTFYNCTGLQKVFIPSGVTAIGREAFSGCTGLTDILIPKTVQSIGLWAFYRCTGLTKATVCAGEIGKEAFSGCHDLTELVLKDGVTAIGEEAFYGCIGLTKLNIPGSVTAIGMGAFSYCTDLTEVTIGVGVETIGREAFYDCRQITGVAIPDSVREIGSYAISHRYRTDEDDPDTYIYCSPGSYAQTYAKEHDFPVIATFGGNLPRLQDGPRFIAYGTGATVTNVSYDLSGGGLAATKSGYYTIGIENCTLSAKAKTQLALVPETTGSAISAVHAEGRDVLAKGFTSPMSGSLQLQVYPASGVETTRFQFLQNNTVIAESDDGLFNLAAEDLQQESGYAVRLIDQNGKPRAKLYLGKASKQETPEVDLRLPGITIKVPDSVPVIGGGEFSIDFEQLPLVLYASEDRIQIGIGAKRSDSDADDDSEIQEIKSLIDRLKDDYTQIKEGTFPHDPFTLGESLSWNACGYMDIRKGADGWELVSSGFAVGASGKIEKSIQTFFAPLAMPVLIKMKGEASGKAKLELTADPDWVVGLNGAIQLEVPTATLSVGPGIKKLVDLSVYGSFTNKITIDFTVPYTTAALTGSIGISANLLGLTYRQTLLEPEKALQYYPSEPDRRTAPSLDRAVADATDLNRYTVVRKNFNASSAFRMTDDTPSPAFSCWEQERQTGVYNDASPQMVSLANGKQILVWVDDVEERTDFNHTAVMYSVFDPDEYCWTEPSIVYDNGTADYTPQIATDGQVAYVVWCDANTVFSGEETLTEIASHSEICVAQFDDANNCFAQPEQLTTDNYYDTMPSVFVRNGLYYVVWVQNRANDPLLIQGDNRIYYKMSDQIVHRKYISTLPITELQLGMLGNQIAIAFISDADRNYSTVDDMELSMCPWAGSPRHVNGDGTLSNLAFTSLGGQRVLTLWKDGDLVSVDSYNAASVMTMKTQIEGVLSSDFTMVAGEDQTLLLCQTVDSSDGSNLYAYRYQNGAWSKPVRMTDGDGYIRSVSGFYDGYGDLQLAYVREEPAVSGEDLDISTTLYTGTYYPEDANLTLVSVDYDEAGIRAGENLPITLTIQNNGFAAVEGLRITVEDEDWTTGFEQLTDTVIGIGETVSVTVDFPFPELEGVGTYTITAEPAYDYDADWSDNDAEMELGYTDLSLSIEQSFSGRAQSAVLTVGNAGRKDEEVYLVIYEGSRDGRRLQSFSLGVIEAGQTAQFCFDAQWLRQFDTANLYFEVACATPDRAEYNNGDYLIHQKQMLPFGETGQIDYYYDANGDGVVDVRDLVRIRKLMNDHENEERNAGYDLTGDAVLNEQDLSELRNKML